MRGGSEMVDLRPYDVARQGTGPVLKHFVRQIRPGFRFLCPQNRGAGLVCPVCHNFLEFFSAVVCIFSVIDYRFCIKSILFIAPPTLHIFLLKHCSVFSQLDFRIFELSHHILNLHPLS